MAKLYWRVKRDGKWTWVSVDHGYDLNIDVHDSLWDDGDNAELGAQIVYSLRQLYKEEEE